MNNHTIYQVDSFSEEIFKGNPAGVMILESELDTSTMQNIASEMNLSETAFIIPEGENYKIRYFTPTIEVPICGHATLASAHILYSLGIVKKDEEISFKAKLDDLTIKLVDNWISMSFPRFEIRQIKVPGQLNKAINSVVSEFYVDTQNGWNLAFIDSDTNLLDLKLNFSLIAQIIPELLIVTSKDYKNDYDFFVRCFAPNAGINEDPVTGAANCVLSTFWGEKT